MENKPCASAAFARLYGGRNRCRTGSAAFASGRVRLQFGQPRKGMV